MKRLIAALCATLFVGLSGSATAQATGGADPGQALGQCMVLKSTGADRVLVARWLLSVLASAPQAADVATLQPGKKPAIDQAMAKLLTRLMTSECATEARAVSAAGGNPTVGFQVAGEALGRVAMQELLGNPRTQEALGAYLRYINPADFAALAPKPKP